MIKAGLRPADGCGRRTRRPRRLCFSAVEIPIVLSIIAIVLSAVSLAVSAAAALYTRRQAIATEDTARIEKDRRRDEIATAARQLEASQRADVAIKLSLPTANATRKIELHNAGPADAEILIVTYQDADDGRPAPDTTASRHLSGRLPAGHSKEVVAGLTEESSRRFRVATEWRDGNGAHREETTLQV
jgi:hypothetical protein